MIATTSVGAPYDALRAIRCRQVRDGRACGRVLGEIDWSREGIHARTCPKCGAANVVYVSPTVRHTDEGGA